MEAWEAANNALACVLEAKKGESIAIFCDHEKMDVGQAFAEGALKLGLQTRLVSLKVDRKAFRKEVPSSLIEIIKKRTPDIYINLVRGNREETPFRIRLIQMETKGHKERLGHCPGVTLDMLTEGAMALSVGEHRQMQGFAQRMIQKLGEAERIEAVNPAGTKLAMRVEGRPFFTDTIIDWKTMKWMNLPTGEVIVAPIEDSLEGTLVCDMAIGGIGPLRIPVAFTVRNGIVQKVSCNDRKVLKRVEASLSTDDRSNRVGEFAFGINPKARFAEEFLESEKLLGTIHIAFGNNVDMPGGDNPSKNHMDLLVSKPTVKAYYKDRSSFNVLDDGLFRSL